MYRPHIWKYGGTWFCGKKLVTGMGFITVVPVAPLFGDGNSPAEAYADWLKVTGVQAVCRPQPFERGDVVRQGWDTAIVLCAHHNGALDVRSIHNGKEYGWSACMCELVRKSGPGDVIPMPAPKPVKKRWWSYKFLPW